MTKTTWTIALLLVACSVLVALQHHRWSRAAAAVETVELRLVRAQQDAQRLEDLRGRAERISLGQRPPQDVIARLREAMADAGVPPQKLTGVRADATTTSRIGRGDDADRYRTQSVRATLRGITPGEVGRVLVAWRSAQRLWTTTDVSLTHDGGHENRYTAELTLSAVYLEDAP
ncbi:MAG: hypothetical protein AAFX79_00015 [Planctomycetota bacterium]